MDTRRISPEVTAVSIARGRKWLAGLFVLGMVLPTAISCGDSAESATVIGADGSVVDGDMALVEVDLDSFNFRNSHSAMGGTMNISFALVGIAHQKDSLELEILIERRKQRLKDAIIGCVRSAHPAELEDPELKMIQKRLLLTINRSLGEPLLKEVLVTDFQFTVM